MDEKNRGKYDPVAETEGPKLTDEPELTDEQEDDYLAKIADDKPQPEAESVEPQMPDPTRPHRGVPPDYHQPEKKGWLTPVLISLAVLAAAAAFYWFIIKPKPAAKPTAATSPQPAQTAPASQTPKAGAISTKTKAYTSGNFNLAFSYPDDWTVTDITGSGVLTAKSPDVQLDNAAGQVVFTIRDKNQKLSEFNGGNAQALRGSDKIAYAKPTQTQRGSTYASYLTYAGQTGLSGIYITGDNGYQKDQAIPAVDIAKVDPVIDITFVKNGKQATVADSMLSNTAFLTPLLDLLKSLSIN